MKTTKLKLSELVEDFDLYPRADVDSAHVSHIEDAIDASASIPPPIIDEKSKRIIDGFHRVRAWRRSLGDDGEIDVIVRAYKNEREMFLEAMRLNANHGRNMTSYDRTHAIAKATKMDIDPAEIASALNMSIDKVTSFKVDRCAKLENSRRAIPIKRPIWHMRGRELTQEQADVIPNLGGNSQGFYAAQLIKLIKNNLIDSGDERLMEQLKELFELLEGFIAAK